MLDTEQIIFEDLYSLITHPTKKVWPTHYGKVKKLQFMDKLIQYFEKRDDYEKCARLTEVKKEIANGQLRIDNEKDS